ncbi:MAG: NAD(P)/FAD-dependent oxidoreductase [Patescibacteria group bacterium]|nr:NAD(P)/FAD-dependent oxidoreductase [Patescibacteria group bacterium]
MLRPHIVIVGAGFGGTYTAKKLVRLVKKGAIDLTIVNKTNYFLFTPLLHEVATGALGPRSVAEPLREVFAGTGARIVQGETVSIDRAARSIVVDSGGERHSLEYDYLVIATGAEANYYGIRGAKENALPLKSLADAVLIRDRVIGAFEKAVVESDPEKRTPFLSFAVVGGGPTGVEAAAELAELVDGIVRRYYGRAHCRPDDPRHCELGEPSITLVHAGAELLEMFDPRLRLAAAGKLRREGVVIETKASVTEVSREGLSLADGRAIAARTVIWTAGVKAVIPPFAGGEPPMAGGRLAVDEHFNLEGDQRVFVLGDAAAYVGPAERAAGAGGAKPLPQLAQAAQGEAAVVAANVVAAIKGRPLKAFSYRSKGSMVSVGQWFAIGEIYSLDIAGRLTWWLWRTVYLFKFLSWRKRVRIALEWAFELISPRDITTIEG